MPGRAHRFAHGLEAVVPNATVHPLPKVGHLLPDQSATLLDFLRDRHEAGSEG